MTTPEYTLDADSFLAPHYIPKGTRILWDGPVGPHMIPVNDEAKKKVAQYFKDNPGASITPVEDIPMVQVLTPAPAATPAALDLTTAKTEPDPQLVPAATTPQDQTATLKVK